MISIFDKIEKHWEKQLPFVIYNKPNQDDLIGFFQQNDLLHLTEDFTENGFVFNNFDSSQSVLIPEDKAEIVIEKFDFETANFQTIIPSIANSQEKQNHQLLIQKGIDAINSGVFEKVVLSRQETVNISKFNLVNTYKLLLHTYPDAFTYCFYHPKIGLWLGAFSEQLLKIENNNFNTMSLAGTQKAIDNTEPIWQKKEKEEQQYVTDFIVENLQKVTLEIHASKPYSFKAGNLWHIKTDINGVLNVSNIKEALQILHPTPAVCGFPKAEAKKFILENENYDRSFYAGFLGELNKNFTANTQGSDLFVNLRCMQIKDNQAVLYIGGGITKQSNPESEWTETVNKSMIMKQVLNYNQ